VVAEGATLRPVLAERGCRLYALPRRAGTVRLVSPAARPTHSHPWAEDRRRLGLRLDRIVLDGRETLPLDSPALGEGWWPREATAGGRWTNGDAQLHLPPDTHLLELREAR
jgi:hypothetical protein